MPALPTREAYTEPLAERVSGYVNRMKLRIILAVMGLGAGISLFWELVVV